MPSSPSRSTPRRSPALPPSTPYSPSNNFAKINSLRTQRAEIRTSHMPQLEERETRTEPRPTPEAEEIYLRWIRNLDDEFTRHHKPVLRAEIVRVQLHQL